MSEHIARQLWLGEPEEGKAGLRVAFASADHKRVDQHFGSCASLLIYSVAPDRAELLQVTEFNIEQGHNQGKLDSRMAVIADCFAVFCTAVGESVFRQLLAAGWLTPEETAALKKRSRRSLCPKSDDPVSTVTAALGGSRREAKTAST